MVFSFVATPTCVYFQASPVSMRGYFFMPKGFNPVTQNNTRYIAVELNKEDLEQDEVLDLIEIHHIQLRAPTSKKDLKLIQTMSDLISDGCSVISPVELLAELYVTGIANYATAVDANVARIYHNHKLGDNRIRSNSILHLYGLEEGEESTILPAIAVELLSKYLKSVSVTDGEDVTLRDRLGNAVQLSGRDVLKRVNII